MLLVLGLRRLRPYLWAVTCRDAFLYMDFGLDFGLLPGEWSAVRLHLWSLARQRFAAGGTVIPIRITAPFFFRTAGVIHHEVLECSVGSGVRPLLCH